MQKGFTLVELAIVLVVIGIIMTFAIKGRVLMQNAAVVADVASIRKTETAVNLYYTKYGIWPTSFSQMVDSNMITVQEVTSKLYKSGRGG